METLVREHSVEEFESHYNFVLSDSQREQLERAKTSSRKVRAHIGFVLGMRYLLGLECIERA